MNTQLIDEHSHPPIDARDTHNAYDMHDGRNVQRNNEHNNEQHIPVLPQTATASPTNALSRTTTIDTTAIAPAPELLPTMQSEPYRNITHNNADVTATHPMNRATVSASWGTPSYQLALDTQSNTSLSDVSNLFDPTSKTLLTRKDLPGPLGMNRLSTYGTLHILDYANAYSAEHAGTLYGRARIASILIPFGTIACTLTALWVWLGGAFPKTVDVLSTSHYRAMSYGRRIRVFNRKTSTSHVADIGDTRITTPLRTACDIAMLLPNECAESEVCEMLCALMEAYKFKPTHCLAVLEDNRFWPNTQAAKELLQSIQHFF